MNSQNTPNCPSLSEATICQIILDDSDAKIPKRPKVKEINLKPDKPEPTDKVPEPDKTKTKFQPMGIVSNLSRTLLQKHQAVKYLSEYKNKFMQKSLQLLPRENPSKKYPR